MKLWQFCSALAHVSLRGSPLATINDLLSRVVDEGERIALNCRVENEALNAQFARAKEELAALNLKSGGFVTALNSLKNLEEKIREELTDLQEAREDHHCMTQHSVFDQELVILQNDLTETIKFANATKCEQKQALVQCETLDQIRSDRARRSLQQSLLFQNDDERFAQFYRRIHPHSHRRHHLHRRHHRTRDHTSSKRRPHSHPRHHHHRTTNRHLHARQHEAFISTRSFAAPTSTHTNTSSNTTTTTSSTQLYNISDPQNVTHHVPRRRRCHLKGANTCPGMQDALMSTIGGVQDEIDHLRLEIDTLVNECRAMITHHREEITQLVNRHDAIDRNIAHIMTKKMQTAEQARLALQQTTLVARRRKDHANICSQHVQENADQQCGFRNTRRVAMSTNSPPPEDCVLSDWSEEECSQHCGMRGEKRLTRRIIMPANSVGVACSRVLTKDVACNRHECPLDCEMADWGGWSKCSARCGGGIKIRERGVKQDSAFGGLPCGEDMRSEVCNVEACDDACVWHVWTAWSGCTRACNGFQRRARSPRSGTCDQDDHHRVVWRQCNVADRCDVLKGQCNSTLDIVFALDGSGSVRAMDFKRAAGFVNTIFKRLGNSPRILGSLVVFGGPSSVGDLKDCDAGKTDSCGITLLSETLEPNTGPLSFSPKQPKKHVGTNTAGAIGAAEILLRSGNADAQSLVIVITDGNPNSKFKVDSAAKHVRSSARLSFIVIGGNHMDYFHRWASQPLPENLIFIPSYARLDHIVDQVVENVCPVF
eukprot:GEMP01016906.1.p1 GENE.GEMP01016906.1~~GEMP01016906.1.p1  ORF type:complete len:769 (+),score=188.60 GEMP01016906.1:33-2339(+)